MKTAVEVVFGLITVTAGAMMAWAASSIACYIHDKIYDKSEETIIGQLKGMQQSTDFGETFDGCCIICNAEHSRRGDRLPPKDRGGDIQVSDTDNVIALHPCKQQVVMTVNAPPAFRFSLDFLPCFQGSDTKLEVYLQNGWILGGSNGLLLCSFERKQHGWGATQYYLCNPLTKHWIALPPTPKSMCVVYLGFIFEPCPNFGNTELHEPLPCASACRFKVFRMPYTFLHFELEILSSEVGQWTSVKLESTPNQPPSGLGSLFHNGRLHWLSKGYVSVYDPFNNKLHDYSIAPPKTTQCCMISDIQGPRLSRGSLWLFQVAETSLFLRLWELKGYDNDKSNLKNCYWKPHRLVDLKEIIGDDNVCINMLAIHPHDPDIVYLELRKKHQSYHSMIARCNLSSKIMEHSQFQRHPCCDLDHVITLAFN